MRKLLVGVVAGLVMTTGAMAQGTVRVALGTTLTQLDPAKTTIGDEYIYVH